MLINLLQLVRRHSFTIFHNSINILTMLQIARKMVLKCVPINEELYQLEMPLLLTATLTKAGVFIVSSRHPAQMDFCFLCFIQEVLNSHKLLSLLLINFLWILCTDRICLADLFGFCRRPIVCRQSFQEILCFWVKLFLD